MAAKFDLLAHIDDYIRRVSSPAGDSLDFTKDPAVNPQARSLDFTKDPAVNPQARSLDFTKDPAVNPNARSLDFTKDPAVNPQARSLDFTNDPAVNPQARSLDFTKDPRVNPELRNLDFTKGTQDLRTSLDMTQEARPSLDFTKDPRVARPAGSTLYSKAANVIPQDASIPTLTNVVQEGAAPAADASRAYRIGAGVGKVARFGAKFLAPAAGAIQAVEGLSGAPTVGNAIRTGVGVGTILNPAVGGPIALGMTGAELAGDAIDRTFEPGKSTILNPAFGAKVAAAGGTAAYIKSLNTTTPATAADVAQNDRELNRVGPVSAPAQAPAGSLQVGVDAKGAPIISNVPNDTSFNLQGVPAGGSAEAPVRNPLMPFGERVTGFGADADRINARIRAIGSNPDAMAAITASATAPRTYTTPDGKSTTNYNESEQYLSGVARANADKSALTKIQDEKDLQDAKDAVKFAGSPARLAAATTALGAVRTSQAAKATNAVALADLQRKSVADQQKFLIDALTGASTAGKNNAETAAVNARLGAVAAAAKAGAKPAELAVLAAGRSPSNANEFTVPQVLDPNAPVPVLDKSTGKVTLTKPQVQASIAKANDGKYYVVGADGKATREASKTEIAQLKK